MMEPPCLAIIKLLCLCMLLHGGVISEFFFVVNYYIRRACREVTMVHDRYVLSFLQQIVLPASDQSTSY